MSTIRNPVGPQPPGVYWKRRLVVLLGLIAIVVVVVLIVVRPGSGTPTQTTNTPSPSASSAAPDDESEAEACDPFDVELTAIVDKTAYAAGEIPQISLSITNRGDEPCTIGVGTDLQEYRISSGADPVWNSRDCQEREDAAETVLQPGVPKSTAPIPWDRTRSSPETCDGERPEMPAGDKTYSLTVALGELESEAVRFRLL